MWNFVIYILPFLKTTWFRKQKIHFFFMRGTRGPCTCEANSLSLTCASRPPKWRHFKTSWIWQVWRLVKLDASSRPLCVCARLCVYSCVILCHCRILLSKWFMIFWFYKSTCSWSLLTLFICSLLKLMMLRV